MAHHAVAAPFRNERATASEDHALLFTVEQVARRLGIGRTTVFGLIRTGELQSVRIGRARRIPAEALTNYIRSLAQHQVA